MSTGFAERIGVKLKHGGRLCCGGLARRMLAMFHLYLVVWGGWQKEHSLLECVGAVGLLPKALPRALGVTAFDT